MVSGHAIGDSKILAKKVPRNPRYETVESRLNTGSSLTRYMKKIEDVQSNFKVNIGF